MSVRKTKQGRYEVRVQHEGRRVRAGAFDTLEEANHVDIRTRVELTTGSYVKNVMNYEQSDQKFSWRNPIKWLREQRARDKQMELANEAKLEKM